jgi:hypothetical protein
VIVDFKKDTRPRLPSPVVSDEMDGDTPPCLSD